MKILIIEDEKELSEIICGYLHQQNYLCETAMTYTDAELKLSVYKYDVVLLDLMLPDGNGMNLLKIIKENNYKPGVIILSAKDKIEDKIAGLDSGADDYLAKPFHVAELNSRIRAVIRRNHFDRENILKFNELKIDTDNKTISIRENIIPFTRKEFDLYQFFVMNKERVLTKENLAEHLWNDNIDLADNYDFIYTHLNNIRKKIKSAGGNDYIKTIYGLGYKFSDQ